MRIQALDSVDWVAMQNTVWRVVRPFDKKGMRPAQLVAGVAVVFIAVCRHFNLRPVDVMQRVDNIIRDMQEGHKIGPGKRIYKALELWLEGEFRGEHRESRLARLPR